MNDGHEKTRNAINHVDCPCTRMFLKVRKSFLFLVPPQKKLLLVSLIMTKVYTQLLEEGHFCRHIVISWECIWKDKTRCLFDRAYYLIVEIKCLVELKSFFSMLSNKNQLKSFEIKIVLKNCPQAIYFINLIPNFSW
jgi:hypothetical protein